MELDDERPTCRMTRVSLDELVAAEAEEAERDGDEATIQEAAPTPLPGIPSPIGDSPPSERTVIMSWVTPPIQERRFR